jgi:hypothetical protein
MKVPIKPCRVVCTWRPTMRWGDDGSEGSECLQAFFGTFFGPQNGMRNHLVNQVKSVSLGKCESDFDTYIIQRVSPAQKAETMGGFDWDLSYSGAVLWGMSLYQMSHLVNYYLSTITPNIPPPIWASGASIGACNSIKPSFQVFLKKYFDIGGPVNSP